MVSWTQTQLSALAALLFNQTNPSEENSSGSTVSGRISYCGNITVLSFREEFLLEMSIFWGILKNVLSGHFRLKFGLKENLGKNFKFDLNYLESVVSSTTARFLNMNCFIFSEKYQNLSCSNVLFIWEALCRKHGSRSSLEGAMSIQRSTESTKKATVSICNSWSDI